MLPADEGVAEHRQRTVASGLAAFVARTLQGVLALAAALVMARLLTPGDFGVFAMVVPLGILATIAANQCTQTAFLQHPVSDARDLQGYYRFATSVSVSAAVGMSVLGLGLSWLYDEPRVFPVSVAWAAVIAWMSRAAMQEALLKRALRFPVVVTVQLSTWCAGLGAGVIAAWLGVGYWALPLQVIVMEVLRIISINVVSDWRPRRVPARAGPGLVVLRRAWLSLFGLRIASWINEQPDIVAVGRLGGSVVLGSYDTARRWAWYPFEEPYLALTEVTIASLGRLHDEALRFRHLVMRSVLAMLTVSLPIIAYVTVEAESVVRVLLGEQWSSVVPFLRVLGVAAFAGAITRTSAWILLSHGRTARLLRWSLQYQAPTTVLATAIGLTWGAMGVARAIAALAVASVIPALSYGVHGTSVTLRDVLRAAARPVGASVLAAMTIALASGLLPSDAGAPRLAASLVAYLVAFAIAWLGLPNGVRDTAALLVTLNELLPGRRPGGGTNEPR